MVIGVARIGCLPYSPWLVFAVGSTRIGHRANVRDARGRFVAMRIALAAVVTVEPVEYVSYGAPARRPAMVARMVLACAVSVVTADYSSGALLLALRGAATMLLALWHRMTTVEQYGYLPSSALGRSPVPSPRQEGRAERTSSRGDDHGR